MRYVTTCIVALYLIFTASCEKQKFVAQTSYTYPFNSFYNGFYPNQYNVKAELTVTEHEGGIRFLVSLYGLKLADSFSVHIHEKDSTQPFGYSGNPVIDFGTFKQGQFQQSKDITTMSYEQFTKSFKGYFIVHDPLNIQNDTTTLLIYGKTGNVQ